MTITAMKGKLKEWGSNATEYNKRTNKAEKVRKFKLSQLEGTTTAVAAESTVNKQKV